MQKYKILKISLALVLVMLISIGGIFIIYLNQKINRKNSEVKTQRRIVNAFKSNDNSNLKGITSAKVDASSVAGKNTTPDVSVLPSTNNNKTQVSTNLNLKNVLFYNKTTNDKKVALTFDDGPDAKYTPMILDILKQNGIKATFFIVGVQASKNPNVVKRIAEEGHAIGNHTWNHPQIPKLSEEQINNQITSTDNILYSLIGYHTDLFRPPYGAMNNNNIEQVAGMGYKIIDWSVDTRDWAGTRVPQIMTYVRKEFRSGGIILQHCAGNDKNMINTINALKQMIALFKAEGYTFVTIPQLLDVPVSK